MTRQKKWGGKSNKRTEDESVPWNRWDLVNQTRSRTALICEIILLLHIIYSKRQQFSWFECHFYFSSFKCVQALWEIFLDKMNESFTWKLAIKFPMYLYCFAYYSIRPIWIFQIKIRDNVFPSNMLMILYLLYAVHTQLLI